ncbi:hypothetical protein AB0D93_39460, partial [Streptomyces sp. NPDC048191]
MSVDRAVRRALDALCPGAIVQVHIGTTEGQGEVIDAEALPRILDAIAAHGYRVIDLRTLLAGVSLRRLPVSPSWRSSSVSRRRSDALVAWISSSGMA